MDQLEKINMNKEELEKSSIKLTEILKIERKRDLSVTEDEQGMELNEGYEYTVNGAIPEIADGIAKLAIEMDKMTDLGERAGGYFLVLIGEYYNKNKEV